VGFREYKLIRPNKFPLPRGHRLGAWLFFVNRPSRQEVLGNPAGRRRFRAKYAVNTTVLARCKLRHSSKDGRPAHFLFFFLANSSNGFRTPLHRGTINVPFLYTFLGVCEVPLEADEGPAANEPPVLFFPTPLIHRGLRQHQGVQKGAPSSRSSLPWSPSGQLAKTSVHGARFEATFSQQFVAPSP